MLLPIPSRKYFNFNPTVVMGVVEGMKMTPSHATKTLLKRHDSWRWDQLNHPFTVYPCPSLPCCLITEYQQLLKKPDAMGRRYLLQNVGISLFCGGLTTWKCLCSFYSGECFSTVFPSHFEFLIWEVLFDTENISMAKINTILLSKTILWNYENSSAYQEAQ